MKRVIVLGMAVVVTFVLAGGAFAVPPGKSVEFKPQGAAPVVFSGDVHKQFKCNECHPAVFPMKKTDNMTMKEMNEGKFCGHCHNGTKAFSTKANCTKCHKQ